MDTVPPNATPSPYQMKWEELLELRNSLREFNSGLQAGLYNKFGGTAKGAGGLAQFKRAVRVAQLAEVVGDIEEFLSKGNLRIPACCDTTSEAEVLMALGWTEDEVNEMYDEWTASQKAT